VLDLFFYTYYKVEKTLVAIVPIPNELLMALLVTMIRKEKHGNVTKH